MSESNVLLTGVTGILGRHVLYELLHLHVSEQRKGALVVLIRDKPDQASLKRLKSILIHPYRPSYLAGYTLAELLRHITLINAGIEDLNDTHFDMLGDLDNLYIIHCAAATDLSDTDAAHEKAFTNNYLATKHLLDWSVRKLYKFIFVSSAFSIGHYEGLITDRYIEFGAKGDPVLNDAIKNRNPYERFKIKTEYELIQYCRMHGKFWQIIRPSSICGRMLDEPLYYTPTFNVFYLFGKFLSTCSLSGILHRGDQIRIAANPLGSINVVPVDYVAKAIIRSFEDNQVNQLNAVSSKQIPMAYLLQSMCSYEGIKCELIEQVLPPSNMSVVEKQYYETIGPMFSGYFSTPNHQFDTTNLRRILSDIKEADVEKEFKDLFEFAHENGFKSL